MRVKRMPRTLILCFLAVFPVLWLGGCGLETDAETEEEALGVQPKSVTLDAAVVTDVVFTAHGGSGTYAWALSDESLGTLSAGAATAVYTNSAVVGQNTLIVTDGSSTAVATVIQE